MYLAERGRRPLQTGLTIGRTCSGNLRVRISTYWLSTTIGIIKLKYPGSSGAIKMPPCN
jgi:hypothetical protein